MRKKTRWSPFLPLLLLGWAAPALAQQSAEQQALVITAVNRTAAAEAERGQSRTDDRVRRGDHIRYTLTFTNPTDGAVQNVVLHNPLAEGLRFVGGSAAVSGGQARVEYSIDGGKTFSAQPMIEVVEEGKKVRRPASPDLFTDVRWTVETRVQPGARVTASYEVHLPSEVPAAPSAAESRAGRDQRSGSSHL